MDDKLNVCVTMIYKRKTCKNYEGKEIKNSNYSVWAPLCCSFICMAKQSIYFYY